MTFARVKSELIDDLQHSTDGLSWAYSIMKASSYCKTDEDEADLWNFICNPADSRDIPKIKLAMIEQPKTCKIPDREIIKVKQKLEDDEKQGEVEEDVEFRNEVYTNGLISHVVVEPLPPCLD